MASASTVWVSEATPEAPYNSCSHPGYSSIQQAIDSTATKIEVCTGNYQEQLAIERAVTIVGGTGVHVLLPATTARSTTACDSASEAGDGLEDQDLVSVCTAGKVKIQNVHFAAVFPGAPVGPSESCSYNLYGIAVGGGADLELADSTVQGAAPKAIDGCQYGVGVQVGMAYASPAQTGTAKLTEDTVDGYQKNGVTVEGAGSDATIKDVFVTGAGKTAEIAQNGIGVQFGAKAAITDSTITKNECENATCGEDPLTAYQAEGVYFYGAATGSSIKTSHIDENDAGIETEDTTETEPSVSQVHVTKDEIARNRYEGVLLNQGWATVSDDEISDSKVGIEAIQIGEGPFAQLYGPKATAAKDTIAGMSEWAVAGDSDNAPGDKPGSITISNSAISGNPGATVAESVHTNNEAELPIVTKKDT
jgi:hypothetical protein